MKKQLRYAVLLPLIFAGVWLLVDPGVRETVRTGLDLCARSVIPALFPFMVISSLLTSMGLGEVLSGPLGGLMALYGIDGTGAAALALGLLGGYPMGARTAVELYRSRQLSQEEAERLLTFCNNANPAFLITVLGVGVFGSVRAGLWLWIIHIASALITGLLLGRPRHGRRERAEAVRRAAFKAERLSTAFVGAVQSALGGTLNVCAFVVVFRLLARPCQAVSGTVGVVLSGLLELFSALPLLSQDRWGFILAAGLAGWGGASVLCQTAALLGDSGLSLRPCVMGKAVQGVLSAVLAALLAGYVVG